MGPHSVMITYILGAKIRTCIASVVLKEQPFKPQKNSVYRN